jgi:polysaccharide deacetylase family protein (PEP-CTERM system associated)
MMDNALTIDLEDYFTVEAFRERIRFADWENYEIRVEIGLGRILGLLARHQVRATFFVLGWIAERRPELVKRLHDGGHEIACHGYRHEAIHHQSVEEFRQDVRRAKAILEGIINEPVVGYRAPTFSVTQRTLWALSALVDEGYQYDSSIYPIVHDRYGIPTHRRGFHWIDFPNGRAILELPLTTAVVGGRNIPFGGGGYLRIYPLWLTRWLLRRLNEREGRPAVVYLHPWELDPEQPRQQVGLAQGFRHYYNLRSVERKLDRLLREFRFVPIRDMVRARPVSDRMAIPAATDHAGAGGSNSRGVAAGREVGGPLGVYRPRG